MHAYLAAAEPAVKKLQLGCGGNYLEGWLDTDFQPMARHVLKLDASQPFPFPDNSFDYVYSEHMIEHMPYSGGVNMLLESFRVLKPGGRIRITCPDIQFLIDMYQGKPGIHQEYSDWSCKEVISWAPFSDPVFTINNYVRSWNHQFIYSKTVLARTMQMAGFADLEEFNISESNDPVLAGLEIASRMKPGYLQLESMTIEAIKPKE
jgi:predicted SAM-dependent methyltransferase